MARTRALFALLCLAMAALPLQAQSGASSLSGLVTDPTGAVIPGAEIRLQNPSTGIDQGRQADEAGRYTFPLLPPGTYVLTAKQEGFADVEIQNVSVRVNTPVTLNVVFEEVAGITEIVSVDASAAQVNTTDASVGLTFDTKPILQLPLNARNAAGLLSLQAGVTFISADSTDVRSLDPRSGSVNGARSNQSNITLDGVDVNDQVGQGPFTTVLRNTLDSIEEFRVVTNAANADLGRSSGAQVSLVTKSGTNQIHGSAYYFHRNTVTAANDFFNNRAGIERPKLNRNIFGASVGGKIKRDRLFYFLNYEGRRDTSEANVVRTVPTASARQGSLFYLDTSGGFSEFTANQLREADPLGIGPNLGVLDQLNSYPMPNDTTIGDGFNTGGYRFTAPTPLDWNTYIAKIDWNVDSNGEHRVFVRGNLQVDQQDGAPQFSGQDPNTIFRDHSKGLAAGYTAVLSPTLVSTFRYGLTRQAANRQGLLNADTVNFGFGTFPIGTDPTFRFALPVHTISEDMSWTKGGHTVQFGGVLRHIRNHRVNNSRSFNRASGAFWASQGAGFELWSQVPDLSPGFLAPMAGNMFNMLGILNQGFGNYNYDVSGDLLPSGEPVRRSFGVPELELYVQDTWRVTKALTVTGGLRWGRMKAPRELNGQQVSILPELGEFIARRVAFAEAGLPSRDVGRISYIGVDDPGGKPLYPTRSNFGPRLAVAYSPQSTDGFWGKLFGGPGKTSIRAGAGLYYEALGLSLMNRLDDNSFGLATTLSTPIGTYDSATAPRFTGPFDIPGGLVPDAPPGGPSTPPDAFTGTTAVDQDIKAPYSINLTFSFGRELGRGFLLEAGYAGRLSRRSLIGDSSVSQQVDFRDPTSGERLFDSLRALEVQAQDGVPQANVQPIPFFENLYSNAAGDDLTATQAVYGVVSGLSPDTGTALVDLDVNCRPACSDLGAFTFFQPQFWGFRTLRSFGTSEYHSMQWTLRKRFTSGYQFDMNYTLAKSTDLQSIGDLSGLTSSPSFNSSGFSSIFLSRPEVVNNWNRELNRGPSDFDLRHQFNANWVVELPFGRGKPFLDSLGSVGEAFLGGWQVSGLWRWTSGFPLGVSNGSAWPTNWCCGGNARVVGSIPEQTNSRNAAYIGGGSGPGLFDDSTAGLAAFGPALPGGAGVRNNLRGHGLFTVDLAVGKRFQMPFEGHSVQFRAEAFNVSNTVRFGMGLGNLNRTSPGSFGQYTGMLTPGRVIQFGLRYEF